MFSSVHINIKTYSHRTTQPFIPPKSLNKDQLRLCRQRQVWFISFVDKLVGKTGLKTWQIKLSDSSTTRAALLWWGCLATSSVPYLYLHLYSVKYVAWSTFFCIFEAKMTEHLMTKINRLIFTSRDTATTRTTVTKNVRKGLIEWKKAWVGDRINKCGGPVQ